MDSGILKILTPIGIALLIVALAVVAVWLVRAVTIRVLTSIPNIELRTAELRLPTAASLSAVAIGVSFNSLYFGKDWMRPVNFLLPLVLFTSLAWLAVVLLRSVEAGVIHRYSTRSSDERKIAKVRTQVTLLRRVATALIITLAVAAALLTIPEVRALGAGVLASAGLISIVAGLAVQSSLTNVFAGLQLAFTDAVRVDDVVFVNEQTGVVEEITLTYVVVVLFDGKRLILPSTFFTTKPFENWSRRSPELLGTVFLDLDWNVPVAELRAETDRILKESELWDGRSGSLVVTDAVKGSVQVRALVSARNSSDVWDLRCLVRERLVEFIRANYPSAIVRQRWEAEPSSAEIAGTKPATVAQGTTAESPTTPPIR